RATARFDAPWGVKSGALVDDAVAGTTSRWWRRKPGVTDMKKLIFALLTFAAPFTAQLAGTSAHAAGYPWCADYNGMSRSCGSSTYEQCQATLSGNGGPCVENPSYLSPFTPPSRSKTSNPTEHHR